MSYQHVSIGLPGAGMIAVLARQYETLTDEFIQQWMLDLAREHDVSPAYLLVPETARDDLFKIIYSDLRMWDWVNQHVRNDKGERVSCYPNKVTGKPLTIVVFPDLPEKTLFAASLLEMLRETKYPQEAVTIVKRNYGPWGGKEQASE